MHRFFQRAGRHIVDVLTVALFVTAVLLFLRPESWIRTTWAAYRADAATRSAAKRLWGDLTRVSSKLYSGESPMQVVMISDYECPFCRAVSPSVDSALRAGARIGYLHLPLPIRPRAAEAASAALCAEQSGRFPEMHARLIGDSAWRQDMDWTREARAAGVSDIQSFEECLQSPAVAARLRQHMTLSESLFVRATPTFIHSDGVHAGMLTSAELMELSSRE